MSPGCRTCTVSRGEKIWLLVGIILTGVPACGSHFGDSATSSARFSYSSSIQTQLGCSLFRRNIRFVISVANIAVAAAAAAQTSLLMTRGIPVCTRTLISDHISNCQAVVILQDSCTSKPKGFEHLVESVETTNLRKGQSKNQTHSIAKEIDHARKRLHRAAWRRRSAGPVQKLKKNV